MHRLALLAIAMSAPQPLLAAPGDDERRFAASLPCAPGFVPMAWQRAAGRPRLDKVLPPPPLRRDPPRRPPCLRLAAT